VARINAAIGDRLGLDDIRVCPHDDLDGCQCRKPKPGLLLRDAFDAPSSVMIGDRWRDIEAGRAAGCGATILVDYQYDEPVPREPDARVRSLAEAVDWILGRDRRPPAPALRIS
jgi:D-glycero-D-manno-heptose 1,7-bisphosphate phosphatase